MPTRDTDVGILLVEDDEDLAAILAAILRTHGDVHWAATAEDALEEARGREWDLVVSDVELPGMSGIELVRALKLEHPDAAVLILSGHASFEYAVSALRAGAEDYMTKPVEPQALDRKAADLITHARTRRFSHREVILAVGAHPDDVEIGVGGLLARHVAEGHAVTILTCTGGERGGDSAERAGESREAAALLGARLVHASLVDTSVSDGGHTIGTIKEVIDELQPTAVYTHTARDVHQDHRNVHSATLVAARGLPRVYCYQAPSTTVEFHPTRFVAIDEYLDKKLEAIRAYHSQTAIRRYLDEDLLRATARYWARFAQTRYVEPLEVVRESDVAPPALAGAETVLDGR